MGVSERLIEAIQAGKVQSREVLANAAGVEVPTLVSALGALRRAGKIEFDKPNRTSIDYPSIRVVGAARRTVVRRDPKPEKVAEPTAVVARAYVDSAALSRVRDMLTRAADELGTIVGGALPPAEYLRALASQLEVEPAPAKVAKTKRTAKSYRCEDGMGNEVATFATLAEAREHAEDDLDVMVIVDESTGRAVFERDEAEAAEEE